MKRMRIAAAAPAILMGFISATLAGSIQLPGLTTGLTEGYGLTEGLYSASLLDTGVRNPRPAPR